MAARPLLTASLAFVCGAGLGAWLPQEPAAEKRSVTAVVDQGAAAVARGVVQPVAELRRASVLARAGVAGFRQAVRERDDPFGDYGSRKR